MRKGFSRKRAIPNSPSQGDREGRPYKDTALPGKGIVVFVRATLAVALQNNRPGKAGRKGWLDTVFSAA